MPCVCPWDTEYHQGSAATGGGTMTAPPSRPCSVWVHLGDLPPEPTGPLCNPRTDPDPAGQDHYTPTLSAQPGLTVSSGENVTLLCQSGGHRDTFLLAKEGTAESPLRVRADGREWWTQGRFSFHPVTSAHGGTYRTLWGQQPPSLRTPWSTLVSLAPCLCSLASLRPAPCWASSSASSCSDTAATSTRMDTGSQRLPPHTHSLRKVQLEPQGHTQGERKKARTSHKYSIWVTPSPWVLKGSSVTIWCQGLPQAAEYHLYKEGSLEPHSMEVSPSSSSLASFSIGHMSSHWTGQYQCGNNSTHHPAQLSNPLTLLMTGMYPSPSLKAHPSPVVASRGNVTLTCSTWKITDTFFLMKEESAETQKGNSSIFRGVWQAHFFLGPMNTSHRGTYRCYSSHSSLPLLWSLPSTPLHLQVTGVYEAPSLWAWPSSLVTFGDLLTLHCGPEMFDMYALTKNQEDHVPLPSLHGQLSPNFPLGPVNGSHGGQYQCYGAHGRSPVWSKPSAPLDILVSGTGRRPSLSAKPGPRVPEGGDVTLQCRSAVSSDTFHLSKDDSAAVLLSHHLQDPAAPSQANFTLRAFSLAQSGTYRCYSSNSTAPHLLSLPSEPLELLSSGLATPDYTVQNLIRMGMAGCILLLLIMLLIEAQYSQKTPRRSREVTTWKRHPQRENLE